MAEELAVVSAAEIEQFWSIEEIWGEILQHAGSQDCYAFAFVNRAANRGFHTYLKELQPYKPGKVPFRAQRRLANAVLRGGKYHLFLHPPGWGKTLAALATLMQCKRTLILAKPGLVQQMQDEFSSALKQFTFAVYDGNRNDAFSCADSRIVFASLFLRWDNAKHAPLLKQPWDLLIVDEGRALKLLPTEPFSKLVILNATAKDKDVTDMRGTKLDFTVHEDTDECEAMSKQLVYPECKVDVFELRPSWSMEEAHADLHRNFDAHRHLAKDNPFFAGATMWPDFAEMPTLEEIRETWPLYANRMFERYVMTDEDYYGTGFDHGNMTRNIIPRCRIDLLLGSLIKPTDRVLYFADSNDQSPGIDASACKGKTIGEKNYHAIAAWKASGEQWLCLSGSAGQRGFNVQEANVIVTWGYHEWKQRLGRLQRRGQSQDIRWYVLMPRVRYSGMPKPLRSKIRSLRTLTVANLPPPAPA